MRSDVLRMLGWVIPMLCLALAGWIFYSQNNAYIDASAKRNAAQQEVETAQRELNRLKSVGPGAHYAAADDVPIEETDFLKYLHACCDSFHVKFNTYQTQSITYGKDKQGTGQDAKTVELLKGIRKISSTITYLGTYEDMRKLLGQLEASDRLFTLTNISWSLSDKGTTLTMTVSRYVQPAPPAPAKPADKPGAAKPGVAPVVGAPATGTKPGAPVTLGAVAPAKPGEVAVPPASGIKPRPGLPTANQPVSKPNLGVTSKP